MENRGTIRAVKFETGPSYLGRMPYGEDLLTAVEDFCALKDIDTAVFTMIGALQTATLGAYDHEQQVYVTFKKEEPLEIVHCTGNVTFKEDKRLVHAHAVLSDMDGHCVGGHLFSESRIFAGEISLQKLKGPRLTRTYDEQTGLWLWDGSPFSTD